MIEFLNKYPWLALPGTVSVCVVSLWALVFAVAKIVQFNEWLKK